MKCKSAIVLCLMLLLATPVMALDMGMQTCTGVGYRSADGSLTGWAQGKLVTETSEKTFVLVKGGGTVEPSVAQGFEVGAEFGVLATNRLMVRIGAQYQQTYFTDDAIADSANTKSPLISLGGDYYFSDVLADDNEIIGATLSIIYNSETKETGIFGGFVFWFGKNNTDR